MQQTNSDQHQKAVLSKQNPQVSKSSFQKLMVEIKNLDWKSNLTTSFQSHSLSMYALELKELSPEDIQNLYQKLQEKYAKIHKIRNHWMQNQFKIFLWLVAVSPTFIQIPFKQYGSNQFSKLASPFFQINEIFCQHQFKLIFFPQKTPWTPEEDLLLSELCLNNTLNLTWSFIARQLFVISDKKHLRSSQACRQRWKNHLDTKKLKSGWTDKQDYIIIKTINNFGKRWSIISKKLGYMRTQHMVKNRYKIILKSQSRKKVIRLSQEELICLEIEKKLLNRIKKQQQLNQFNKCDHQDLLENYNNYKFKKNKYTSVCCEVQKFKTQIQAQKIQYFQFEKPSKAHSNDNAVEADADNDISHYFIKTRSEAEESPFQYPLFLEEAPFLKNIQKDNTIQKQGK